MKNTFSKQFEGIYKKLRYVEAQETIDISRIGMKTILIRRAKFTYRLSTPDFKRFYEKLQSKNKR